MKLFSSLRTVLSMLLLMPLMAVAQIADGKVYMFTNLQYTDRSMSATADAYGATSITDASDYSQMWYVTQDGSNFLLRNLGTGLYLRSSKATSGAWTLVNADKVDGNCKMKCTKALRPLPMM